MGGPDLDVAEICRSESCGGVAPAPHLHRWRWTMFSPTRSSRSTGIRSSSGGFGGLSGVEVMLPRFFVLLAAGNPEDAGVGTRCRGVERALEERRR